MLETARGRGRDIPKAVKAILLEALELRDRRDADELPEPDFQAAVAKLEDRFEPNWRVRSAAPTVLKAAFSAISTASSTPSSPSCV